jgi:NadR type nicotinamide-nucleotide adenylyltransferase
MENRVKKIAILGAESTGKSTLAELLAKKYNTIFIPEFARSYFNKNDIKNYSLSDLEQIALEQIELEHELSKNANGFVFCDTTLITIKIWSQNEFKQVPQVISTHIKHSDYDLYLLCNNDVPWKDDGQRMHQHLREHVFKWNKHELIKLNVPYKIVSGIGEDRNQKAIQIIESTFNLVK